MDPPLFSETLTPLDEFESPEVIEERRKRCDEIARAFQLFPETLIPLDEFESPEVIEDWRKRCDEIARAYCEKLGPKSDLSLKIHPIIPPSLRILDGVYDNDYSCYDVDEPIEDYQRDSRDIAARNFRMDYKFVEGRKTLVTTESIIHLEGMCYDSTWIAMYGMDSVCMVTRRQEVDMTRVGAYYQRYCTNQQTRRSYAEAVICDVEALPYDNDLREKLNESIVKPFGVVSFVPDEESSNMEASIADYAAVKPSSKATMFLKGKMKSGSAFTFAETVQTAIRAFQYLCLEELKAEDIWVTTLQIAKNQFEHMRIDQRREHLGVICGGSSSGSAFY